MGKVDEVLAEMRLERERLLLELGRIERAIATLEGTEDAAETVVQQRGTSTAAAREAGAAPYAMLDIYEATARYLSTVDTPKDSSEIAAALRAGGFKTRSRNFVNTVRVMLRRKNGKSTGISVTKDGKRWFVRRKAARPDAPASSSEE